MAQGANGDYFLPPSTYGNNGCTSPPFTLPPPVDPNLTPFDPFCLNDPPAELADTEDGIIGVWSGPGVSGGIFNPAAAGVGSHTLTFTPNSGQCANVNTITVVVNATDAPSFSPFSPICQNASPGSLPGSSLNGITGTWNPATINTATPGTFTYTFTPDAGQCSNPTSIQITITPATTPTFSLVGVICQNSNPQSLPSTSNNGISGTWNPATINTAVPGNFSTTFTPNAGQCAQPVTLGFVINPATDPDFNPVEPLCQNSSAPALPTTSTNGISGTWSPATINTANPGTTTYYFTPTTGQCASADSISVTINANTAPQFDNFGPFCQNASPPALPGTSSNGISGTWSPATINTGSTGTSNYIFTPNSGQCASNATVPITVNATPAAGIPVPLQFCIVVFPPSLLSENSSAVISQINGGNTALTVNWFFDAAATQPILNIANIFANIPPPTTVYANVSNGSCSSATVPVPVQISQAPTINNPGSQTACGTYTLPGITGTNLPGNQAYYTGPNGTGTMYLPGAMITTTTTLYIYAGTGACSDQEQFTVTINPAPIANPPSAPLEVCSNGAGTGVFNLTGLNAQISGGIGTVSWFSNANGTAPITNPGAFSSGPTTVYAVVSSGPCASTPVPVTLSLIPGPAANPAGPISVCPDGNGQGTFPLLNLNGIVSGGTGTVNWFIDPTGNSPINNPGAYISGNTTVYAIVSLGGCNSAAVPVSLEVLPPLNVSLLETQIILCASDANGAIATQVSGGSGPFTFDWNINALDGIQNPQNLGPGTYAVTVTDTNSGCIGSGSITLNAPSALQTVCAQASAETIPGGADGSASIQISGGTPPYNIAWAGPQSGSQSAAIAGTAIINNLAAGNYSVTITDNNGCTQTCSFTINGANCAISVSASSVQPACNGDATGSINLEVQNGSGTLTFDWNVNALNGTQNPTNLVAGTYAVTVTDAAGCSANTTVVLNQPSAVQIQCAQESQVSIIGATDGSAQITIGGGTAPYSIAWNGPSSGNLTVSAPGQQVISGLAAGTYNLTLTDANGCTNVCSFAILSPGCALSIAVSGTSPTCNNGTNGSIQVLVSNNIGAVVFDWNENALDSIQNPTNLPAGNYAVTVTDAAGCSADTTIMLINPAPLAVICNPQSAASTVEGNDGIASIAIGGGTPGYTLSWTGPVNGTQTSTTAGSVLLDSLRAGNYALTLTDANGCTTNCNFSIAGPNCQIAVSTLGVAPACFGGTNGFINVSVQQATAPLTFNWNVDALDGIQNPVNLGSGLFAVTVTDAIGCTASSTISLTAPPPLAMVCAQLSPVSTPGATDGSALLQISGGRAGYQITWSGPTSGSQAQALAGTATISGLAAGNYIFGITDANGCTTSCSLGIGSPACTLELEIEGNNPSCPGQSNGSIQLTVSNAAGQVNFNWNNNLFGIQNPAGLSAGLYAVTVTDAAGCTANTQITLVDPPQLMVSCSQASSPSSIGGSDGVAAILIFGGTAGYSLNWAGPTIGAQIVITDGPTTIPGLSAGNYSLTVTDDNGCTTTCAFEISPPTCNLSIDLTANNPVCFGAASGSIQLEITGAIGTTTFDWNVNTLDGQQSPSNLSAGAYSVTVSDAAGCTAIAGVSLVNPPAIVLNCAQQSPVTTVGGENGAAVLNFQGGAPGYTIQWSGPESGNQTALSPGNILLSGLLAGNYSVTITDATGCSQTCSFEIQAPVCAMTLLLSGTNPTCNGTASGALNLTVNNPNGAVSFDWNVNTLDGTQNPGALVAGIYSVTVTDAAGCTATSQATLTDPPALTLTCSAQNPGSASINIGGGTGGYSISWSGASSGSQQIAAAGIFTLNNLASGPYNLTLTDANGCTATCGFTICNLSLEIVALHPRCNGDANGLIQTTPINGFGAITWDWNVNALDGQQNPGMLSAGTYTVTATDAAGCTAQATATLLNPSALAVTCAPQLPGGASLQITGGTAAYTVAWSGPVSGSQNVATPGLSTISGLPGGVYSVTVTDGNGCTATCGFTLCNFSLSISGTNPDCNGSRNGSIQVNPVNGFGLINWDWNQNILDGIREPSGLGAGSYAVTATDAAGCTASASIILSEPTALSVLTSVIPPDCLGDGTGAIEITAVSGGTAPYEISLDGVQFSVLGALPRRFGSLPAGSYNILVRDMNDCETTSTVNIPNLQPNTLDLGMDVFLRLGDSVRIEGLANFDIDSVVWTPTFFLSNPDRAATFVRPTENITYRLTAYDASGCSASDEIAIFVERQSGVFAPNAFSPNDDGINDLFTIFADGSVSEIRQLRIFDRWGALVYEQAVLKPNDPAQGWDGRFLGKLLNPGVFLFTAEAEYLDGRLERFSGEVILMR